MKALCSLCLLFVIWPGKHAFADDRGAIVVADVQHGHAGYEIEGKRVDLDGLIESLRQRARVKAIDPRNDIAVVLVSESLTINQVQTVRAALAKFGFTDIRFLLVGPDKRTLGRLSFDTQVRGFTMDRAELLRAVGVTPP
jgi:hypothetical protein